MPKRSATDGKRKALRSLGALHQHPERVTDELFHEDGFFDPHDLVQVKYEMLRRVRVDRKPIRRAAKDFGFSRPVGLPGTGGLRASWLAGSSSG